MTSDDTSVNRRTFLEVAVVGTAALAGCYTVPDRQQRVFGFGGRQTVTTTTTTTTAESSSGDDDSDSDTSTTATTVSDSDPAGFGENGFGGYDYGS